jgi:hypothetical protein
MATFDEQVQTEGEKMRQRILENLRKRGKIGQRVLISDVKFTYEVDQEGKRIFYRFIFERTAPKRIFKGDNVFVKDPLFGKIKPWVKTRSEAAFTKKLNVYEGLTDRYFPDAAAELADYTIQVGTSTILDIITENGG